MTKPGETYAFYVDDFIRIIEKYLWVNIIDSILVNNNLDFPATTSKIQSKSSGTNYYQGYSSWGKAIK